MLEGQQFEPEGRLAQFMRLVDAFERNEIETAVDLFIARLDEIDGDPDREDDGVLEGPGAFAAVAPIGPSNFQDPSYYAEMRAAGEALQTEDDETDGDQEDGNGSEDDFMRHGENWKAEPGCPVSDPGGSDDERAGDPAWIEWQTRGRHKIDQHGSEIMARDPKGHMLHEDAEDDDPRELHGDEQDSNSSEDDFVLHRSNGPGCELSDPGGTDSQRDDGDEPDAAHIRVPYRDRIRAAHCDRIVWRNAWTGAAFVDQITYRLKHSGHTYVGRSRIVGL